MRIILGKVLYRGCLYYFLVDFNPDCGIFLLASYAVVIFSRPYGTTYWGELPRVGLKGRPLTRLMFKGIWENLPAKAERVPGSQKVLSAGNGSPLHMPQGATRRSPKRGFKVTGLVRKQDSFEEIIFEECRF